MKKTFLFLILLLLAVPVLALAAPNHFYNDEANINSDPNYVPGDWPLPEIFEAKTIYQHEKRKLTENYSPADYENLFTLGLGEITFSNTKNESASVAGYFHEYTGFLQVGSKGPEKMELLININSLDTGVPGRNNRIMGLFFQSMKPDFGYSAVTFTQFDLQGKNWKDLKNGEQHTIKAKGLIQLNGEKQQLQVSLYVTRKYDTWVVESVTPITLLISDFGFESQIYELLKSCNHKSISNAVTINVKLFLK